MIRINIGDFVIWEKQDNSEPTYQYCVDDVQKLSNRQLPIINVIIENSLKNDNYITSTEIAEVLDAQGIKDYDRDIVKKTIQRIRADKRWADAIESTFNGYKVNYVREEMTTESTQDEEESLDFKGMNEVLYTVLVNLRESIKIGDSQSICEYMNYLHIVVNEFFLFAEKNRYAQKEQASAANEIVEQFNAFGDPYNAFVNSQDRMSESAQRMAAQAEVEYNKLIDLALKNMN